MAEYTWRPVGEADLAALPALDDACRAVDGPVSVPAPSYRDLLEDEETHLRCATPAEAGAPIVAAGWVQREAAGMRLGGKVHPAHRQRGLGSALLGWAAGEAGRLGASGPLIIRNEALHADSAALYTREGFHLDFAEDWMERDLRAPLPAIPLPVRVESWTTANAPRFFVAYQEAFKTRPGFAPPPAANWIAEYAEDPDFRPDLSLLALDGETPVGFLAAGVLPVADLDESVGWVSQVGVRPEWRGRGIAAALIVATLAAFRREGFRTAGLHVNVNNPEAIRVYTQLGYQVVNRRAKYSKRSSAPRHTPAAVV